MKTYQLGERIYSESNLRSCFEKQLKSFKTEKARKTLTPKKKSSKTEQISWLLSGFVMWAGGKIEPELFIRCLKGECSTFSTTWILEYLDDIGVLIGAYAYRLTDYLYWKLPENNVPITGEFFKAYDEDRNPVDIDSSVVTPQSCFERFFVQDPQCILEHCQEMIHEFTIHYTQEGKIDHLAFISYLSDLVSIYPEQILTIYSAIHCLIESLSIQDAMTECIDDCESRISDEDEYDYTPHPHITIIVADMILKKSEDLNILK